MSWVLWQVLGLSLFASIVHHFFRSAFRRFFLTYALSARHLFMRFSLHAVDFHLLFDCLCVCLSVVCYCSCFLSCSSSGCFADDEAFSFLCETHTMYPPGSPMWRIAKVTTSNRLLALSHVVSRRSEPSVYIVCTCLQISATGLPTNP